MKKLIKIALLGAVGVLIAVRLHGAEQQLNNDAEVLRKYLNNRTQALNQYVKDNNIDISLGWGGFDPLMQVKYGEMLTLPFFTAQTDSTLDLYAKAWHAKHANDNENTLYGFADAIELATTVGAANKALYIYHKNIIDEDAAERAEIKAKVNRESRFKYLKDVWAFLKGEKEDAKWAFAYLIGYALTFIAGVLLLIKSIDYLFLPPKPKIIDEELITVWYNNWRVKRPKSRLNELKYNKDVKEWVDTNIYLDKSRVSYYNTRWINREKYSHKSVLLKGPAGTGKSSLAEEYAKECGYNYIKVGGASWSQLPAGEAVTEFKKTVERAKRSSRPVVIFIDEIDRLGSKMSQSDVDSKVSGAFLNLFPMQRHKKIKFFFASNQPELLPDNFLSRCGDEVYVGIPDAPVAAEIFTEYIAKHAQLLGVELQKLAIPSLQGLNGRQIEDICIEAAERAELADEPITQQLINQLVADKQRQQQ